MMTKTVCIQRLQQLRANYDYETINDTDCVELRNAVIRRTVDDIIDIVELAPENISIDNTTFHSLVAEYLTTHRSSKALIAAMWASIVLVNNIAETEEGPTLWDRFKLHRAALQQVFRNMQDELLKQSTNLPKCPKCGALPGCQHKEGCTVERCSVCGKNKVLCQCEDHDKAFARWTGYLPGEFECKMLSLTTIDQTTLDQIPNMSLFIGLQLDKTFFIKRKHEAVSGVAADIYEHIKKYEKFIEISEKK